MRDIQYKRTRLLTLLLTASVALSLGITLTAKASPTGRSQWVWGEVLGIMGDPVRRDHVLNLWESQGIDAGYLWLDATVMSIAPNFYRSLIADMHARGMKAYSLDGDLNFVLPGAPHDQAITRFQSVLDFNAASAPNEQFDGAHFDNEPWALAQWNTDKALTIQQYLTLSTEYIQMRDDAGSAMTISADVPNQFAAPSIPEMVSTTWNGEAKALYKHAQDIYDTVTLMDYRDFALGFDSIDFHAQPWLDYGDLIGKPVEIGVETGSPGGDPEKVTFFEEGIAFMEIELALAETQFLPRPSFDGFAIHHLASFETLLLAEAIPGDVNLDGVVNGTDLSVLNQNLGNTGEFWTHGDVNQDTVVDGTDFLAWQRNFGAAPLPAVSAANTVPEPSTLALTALLLVQIGLVFRRSDRLQRKCLS